MKSLPEVGARLNPGRGVNILVLSYTGDCIFRYQCKPEQVQAVEDSIDERLKRDQLPFRVGDVITVLNKT